MSKELNTAFRALRKQGYFARQNFWCCSSCGCYAVPEDKAETFVFYHRQDADRLAETGETYLTWAGDPTVIRSVFECAGMEVEHDGSESTRILVKHKEA